MSKIGQIKPFPYPSPQTEDIPITLASGACAFLPSGNYLITPGTNTRIEWMDPIAQQWHVLSGGLLGGQQMSVDGCNYRLHNISGTVSLNLTGAGSGAVNGIGYAATGVAVAIAAAPAGGQNATAQAVVGGAVAAPTVVQAGSGFVAVPLILIDPPPPGGVQATAYATLTAGGAINTVVMDNPGAGYTSSPNFYIIPQPAVYQGSTILGAPADLWPAPGLVHPANLPQGSIFQPNQSASAGAYLTSNPLTGSGTITALGLLNAGGGYVTTAPAVTITGAGAATATTTLGPAPAVDRSYLQSRVG